MQNATHTSRKVEIDATELVRKLLSLDPNKRLSLLDSCGVGGERFLIAGFDPFETIEVRHGTATISWSEGTEHLETDALELLDLKLEQYRTPALSANASPKSACIATFSYELAHQIERIRSDRRQVANRVEPDAVFAFYHALVVHDYLNGTTHIVGSDIREVEAAENTLRTASPIAESKFAGSTNAESNMTRDQYLAAIDWIKSNIAEGNIYQANLTQRFSCTLGDNDSAERVFLQLRRDHPAPFAAFIRRREDTVVSISPERFLRVVTSNGLRRIQAQPIKGTRPRGINPSDDALLRDELLTSEKDRAENVMIVDLLRNDLGRVCNYGSVEVSDLCSLAEHPSLFHLVSTVRGTLRDDVTAGDIMRACFPCGSITGAPKIRAMEIIDEVENVPRDLSMGAIGYFGFDGSLDLSVAIRTMTVRDGVAQFNVGGGIVADSDPSKEYDESLIKARALFRALGVTNH